MRLSRLRESTARLVPPMTVAPIEKVFKDGRVLTLFDAVGCVTNMVYDNYGKAIVSLSPVEPKDQDDE